MKLFLIEYDRRKGLIDLREYAEADSARAMADRLKRELEVSAEPDVEIVLLGAESKEALRSTHARYFRTLRELASDWIAALQPS